MARTGLYMFLALIGCALFGCSGVDSSVQSRESVGDGVTPGMGSGTGAGASSGTGVSPPSVAIGTPTSGAAGPASGDSASGSPSSTPVATPTPSGNGNVAPGLLTAGTWDDNRNFEFFL